MESKKNHTQESIALGAGLIGQAKGDIAAARRAAGEAFEWLCTIDHTYKPEQTQSVPVSDDYRQRMEQQVRVLTEGREKAEKMVSKLQDAEHIYERELRELRDELVVERDLNIRTLNRVCELEAELADHKGEDKRKVQAQPAPTQPAPIQPPKLVNLTKADDEFAHLPPAMREFARQAAAARKLEID